MKVAGLTFNMMTLGGLAAGIGLFIDDAIVMIEAIHRSRETGSRRRRSGRRSRVARPLIASTATVVIVFMPLVFLSGVTGVFFRALASPSAAVWRFRSSSRSISIPRWSG